MTNQTESQHITSHHNTTSPHTAQNMTFHYRHHKYVPSLPDISAIEILAAASTSAEASTDPSITSLLKSSIPEGRCTMRVKREESKYQSQGILSSIQAGWRLDPQQIKKIIMLNIN